MMTLPAAEQTRFQSSMAGSFPSFRRRFAEASCLLVAFVFLARPSLGLLLPDAFAAADPACECEFESPAEELASDDVELFAIAGEGGVLTATTDRWMALLGETGHRLPPQPSLRKPLARGPPA